MRKLKSTIILMNIVIVGIVALLVSFISINHLRKNNLEETRKYKAILRKFYDKNIQNQADNVIKLLDGIHKI